MEENNKIDMILIQENATLRDVMNNIDNSGLGICIIINNEKKIKGILSDGDIRRAILTGHSIEDSASKIMNKNPTIVTGNFSLKELEKKLQGYASKLEKEEKPND